MPEPRSFFRNRPDKQRLLITTLDGFTGAVRAHFNPHEVTIEKTVTWSDDKAVGKKEPGLQYTSGSSRGMSMELMFDRFEGAKGNGDTIDAELQMLQQMTLPVVPEGKKNKRRPPHLEISNGPIEKFQCVIESLTIKVTMFNENMKPVRATATIKFKELRHDPKADGDKPNNVGGGSGDRTGTNWYAASDADIKASREQGRKDRERIELLESLE